MNRQKPRDHGGGVDAAADRWGGARADWLDLSTGINPVPYPVPDIPAQDWTALPDRRAFEALEGAARAFWDVPDKLDILPAPGASALIAAIPGLRAPGRVEIPGPTYNEHGAAFAAHGWREGTGDTAAFVAVHPNNPDGRIWTPDEVPQGRPLTVLDESFCDVKPETTLLTLADRPDTILLKSFGKFWGLAGARLGFALGRPETLAPLRDRLGPWAVSGPALRIGTRALRDTGWAARTRSRLDREAARLDACAADYGWHCVGGTALFRLYETPDAAQAQAHLARHRILARKFPYARSWLRLGLPGSEKDWARLSRALSP